MWCCEDEAKASAQDKVSRQATRSAPARLPPPIRPASISISCCSLTCSSSPFASALWAQMQRGVVTSLSHKNAHLLKMWQPWAIGSLDSSNRCLFEHARCPHDLFQDAI
uniref:Uncharacterized protein n=1 Tax=Triticum urartu TaxID=4572 RepID=A0A8R7QUW8_TRIUA